MDDIYKTRKTLLFKIKDQYNDDAWAEFSEVYKHYIYAIIRGMKITAADADDIVQKIMMRLWKKLPEMSYDEQKSFRAFLAVVTKNEVLRFIEHRKRQMKRDQNAYDTDDGDYLSTIRLPEIEQIAQKEWEIYLTNRAFENLAKDYDTKAIEGFKMCLKGIGVGEVARLIGVEEKMVYNLRFRMKERFSKEIAKLRQDLE
ncbi:RNA polymerase sigma factor [Lentisphaera profundi]|uniref:RNA polymerase sigma factor n=1 Tax=Lentisphaera profundi TaxID=1658616 RepID=A0ABY7VTG9_9BACT|nr:RNA polymerase sigma factor [Lentisphaera profundi]WDE96563.1 RNA polymerase sigma factor [Lentisphaera profundi]